MSTGAYILAGTAILVGTVIAHQLERIADVLERLHYLAGKRDDREAATARREAAMFGGTEAER